MTYVLSPVDSGWCCFPVVRSMRWKRNSGGLSGCVPICSAVAPAPRRAAEHMCGVAGVVLLNSPANEAFLMTPCVLQACSLLSFILRWYTLLCLVGRATGVRFPEKGGAEEVLLLGNCVLCCEVGADTCRLFFSRDGVAVCRPWFPTLKMRVSILRCFY